ncbi:MAG: threonine aldolase [Nocardioides sp.]|nr:threonine aldolase [Nocardioides sp.]
MNDDLTTQVRTALRTADRGVFWHPTRTPAEVFTGLAEAADELGLTEWDVYGDDGAVAMLEEQIATLLGKEAAVFVPSGIMAQQAVLRVWCDRSGSRRVAIPDLSHLLTYEADGPQLLHGFEFEHLTTGREVATADHLAKVPGRLGAAMVELPLRDAGCLLPTLTELQELSAAALQRGVPLHFDGARLWESQANYDVPLAELAGLADSVYVSFYKGLAGLPGAAVAADTDVIDEVRLWRKRMGGALHRLTPLALSALVGLRDRLPHAAEELAWARAFADELADRGLRPYPEVPHTCIFEVYADAPADEMNERLLDLVLRTATGVSPPWRAADMPGTSVCEVSAYGQALQHDPAQVADWFGELAGRP